MNPIYLLQRYFGRYMLRHVVVLCLLFSVSWGLYHNGFFWMGYVQWISLIIISSIIIWRAGDFFHPAAVYIQDRHRIPESVKAAVIDAVASSFPEFCVAVIAVLLIGRAEVGISSIVGSALYNVLIIPAAAGLVATTPMIISREVVWRDNSYYLGVVVLLLALLWFFPDEWGMGVALIFLAAYLGYIALLQLATRKHRAQNDNDSADTAQTAELNPIVEEEDLGIQSEKEAWGWILGMMVLMGLASHMLVESSIAFGEMAGIDAVIMGFVVIAAGTSVPDTVLSVISAMRGNYDASISNVFGSNIFDICVCLSVPILLALAISGETTPIDLPQIEIVWSLIGATLLALYLFQSNQYTLTKSKSAILALVYLLIVVASFSY